VTFTYVVTNNAAEPATITALADDKFGVLAGTRTARWDGLPVGGSCTFAATFAVPRDYRASHVDVFSATATDGTATRIPRPTTRR